MADGDRQTTISNGLPRLSEISRAVTRGIRGLADAASLPSFAASLASASAPIDGGEPGAGPGAPHDVMRGGRKAGDLSQPGANLMARPGRDRAVGASPRTMFDPRTRASLASPPASVPASSIAPSAPALPPAVPMLPVAPSARLAPAAAPTRTTTPTVPNVPAASFPQREAYPAAPPGATPAVSVQSTSFATIPGVAISPPPDQSATAASSVVSPSLSAAARSSSLLASTSAGRSGAAGPGLALKEYPRPASGDRAGVLSWASPAPPTGRDLDRFVAEARERRAGWVTFVADPGRIDAYTDLADHLTKAGIQPIARIQDPDGSLPAGDVGDLVRELRGHGVRYFQLFDDANVAEQTPDYRVDVPDYAQRWLAAAKAVTANGGLPGIGALSPDGDYDDLGFMRRVLGEVKQRGGADVLGQSWLALRGETPGAAANKADVDDLASRAGWFDRVSRQALGRSLPILATLDPAAGRPEPLTPDPAAPSPTSPSASSPSPLAPTAPSTPVPVEQTERALRDVRRKLPALFAASRGTLEARRT